MKLKILVLASLLLLVNQVSALSIGGGNIFTADWFVGLSSAYDDGESLGAVDSFDLTSLVLDMETKITPVIDDGLDNTALSLLAEEFQTSDVLPVQDLDRCVDHECSAVPEPAMVGLLAIGLLGMVVVRRALSRL